MSPAEIRLNLAKCHFPVRGLGYGTRVGIWLQGCSIRCPGCVVPETWESGPEHDVSLVALLEHLLPWLNLCDGVTISGGEPFDQPGALTALLAALRSLVDGDLLVYSGYPWRTLACTHAPILALADVVISEPFRVSRRQAHPVLFGSMNQQVHELTSLGRTRYADWQNFARELSVAPRPDGLDLAGILGQGELAGLRESLAAKGWPAELTHDAV